MTTDSAELDHSKTRLLQAASGLIWTVVFAIAALVLTWMVDWLLASVFPQATFARGTLALAVGGYAASVALPKPAGLSRVSGIGLALSRSGCRAGLFGLALGVCLAVFSIGVPWLAGAIVFEMTLPDTGIWALGGMQAVPTAVILVIVAAFGEEVLLRGYGLQQLARAITPPGAALAAGVFFGALHAENPSADWVAVVNTSLFGLLFGFAVVRYRSLWPSVGMHLGWNLSLAILGANISGLRMGLTALRATPVGPVLWTGGDYGPEASLVATIAVLGAAVVVWKAPVPADDSPLIWDDVRPSKGGTEESCDGS
ncbi:MAG: type II CAAX endopeptidase family protein [Acidobacteria bacterium]|nr:type II CAAX endopeptidase family protein [Acidobacteriota bacterium]